MLGTSKKAHTSSINDVYHLFGVVQHIGVLEHSSRFRPSYLSIISDGCCYKNLNGRGICAILI